METSAHELTYEAVLDRDGGRVSRRPWGADDQIGRLNWITPETSPPLIARGVLLDVAALHGLDRVPDDLVISPEDLRGAASRQGLELRRGDIVLIRTGKMQVWPAPAYLDMPMPGIDMAAARFLCEEAGAMIVGADTAALEAFPGDEEGYAPVHCYMFATAGRPIIEGGDFWGVGGG